MNTEDTLSEFQEFVLQPIIKERSNDSVSISTRTYPVCRGFGVSSLTVALGRAVQIVADLKPPRAEAGVAAFVDVLEAVHSCPARATSTLSCDVITILCVVSITAAAVGTVLPPGGRPTRLAAGGSCEAWVTAAATVYVVTVFCV